MKVAEEELKKLHYVQRDERGKNSWALHAEDYQAAIACLDYLEQHGSVTITRLYKVTKGSLPKGSKGKSAVVGYTKYIVMRWLWLGQASVKWNNGRCIITLKKSGLNNG